MKYLIIIILSIVMNSFNVRAQIYNKQNTYIDALELARILKQNALVNDSSNQNLVAAYYEILSKYGIDSVEIKKNPFINTLGLQTIELNQLSSFIEKKSNVQTPKLVKIGKGKESSFKIAEYSPSTIESKSPSTSISWEAAAISGVSSFMASRFKQEILHIGINQMFAKITTEKDTNLCRFLFPKSFQYVKTLYGSGDQSYYTSDLMVLKQSALIDLEDIPSNLIHHADLLFPKSIDKNKTKDILQLSHHFISNIKNGYSLDKLITSLTHDSYSVDSNMYRILQLVDLISQATLNKSTGTDYWVQLSNLKSTKSLEFEKKELRFFYGLLYHQLIQIPELKEYIAISDQNTEKISLAKIQQLISIIDQLNRIHEYLKNNNFKLNTTKDFNAYLTLYLNALVKFNYVILESKNEKLARLYTINQQQIELCTKYFNIVDAVQSREYHKIIPLFILEFSPYIHQNTTNLRTLAFISQLSTINTSNDMENLLNSYALPIGGASIKRKSSLNISVNGYVGLTGGAELALGSQQIQFKPNIGLAAPIGISVTGDHHITYFFSIVDLGSIVNQRFGNDTSSYGNLKLEHFFTPGLGIFYNFKKLPISLGFHGNYIPNLRTIKYENNNAHISESNVSVIRINLSLLIDIPFFNLYNKERISKK
jgi:hypothetical protein